MIISSKGKRHIMGYKELTAHKEVVDLKNDLFTFIWIWTEEISTTKM